jgi:hypothetical protein
MEEVVKQDNQFTSCGSAIVTNESIRKELRGDIAEFINRGGKITEYSPTGNVIAEPKIEPHTKPEKRKHTGARPMSNSPITLIPYKNRATARSEHGQNIRKYKSKGSEYYWVQIGALELGKGEQWDHKKALQIRDKVRAENKMPPADY